MQPVCFLPVKKTGKSFRHLDSQAFSAAEPHVDCLKFAALYTLQHGLARNSEPTCCFDHGYLILGRSLDEA